MTIPIIVAILAHDDILRRRVRTWLEGASDIAVVGEAGNKQEALEELHSWHPRVLLADLDTLGDSEEVAHLLACFPETRLIVLHGEAEESRVLEALQWGALGHLAKGNLQPEEVVKAVRSVARSEAFLSPTVAGWIVEEVARRLRAP
ncbi:MAG: hypothetical protein NUW24_07225 [Anaerolineae bacterium]|jgi:DNA-binding NarL/FixJ family response regulator|nr:hypothetical protein [Anaerolineae bacterium]MDH7475511.1 hypothetical protein [Anaerolineae bacterium]